MSEITEKNTCEEGVLIHVDKNKQKVLAVGIFIILFCGLFPMNSIGTIANAMVGDLGHLPIFNLMITIGSMACAIAAPINGQLCNMVGPKKVVIIGTILTMVPQAVMFVAPSMMGMLILRSIAFFFWGLTLCGCLVTISAAFNEEERVRLMGIYGMVAGICSCAAPALSGVLVDTVGWRFVFLVYPIVSIIGFILFTKNMPNTKGLQSSNEKFDVTGTVLFIIVFVSFLTVCTIGGVNFKWLSAPVISLLVVMIIFAVLFVKVEKKKKNAALIPIKLIKARYFGPVLLMAVCGAGSFMIFMTYLVMHIQNVLKVSASQAALTISILAIISIPGSYVFGLVLSKVGKKAIRPAALIGALSSVIAVVYFAFIMNENTKFFVVCAIACVYSVAYTIILGLFQMSCQMTVPDEYRAVATSTTTMGETVGYSVGTTICGIVMNKVLDVNTSLPICFIIAAILAVLMFVFSLILDIKNSSGMSNEE